MWLLFNIVKIKGLSFLKFLIGIFRFCLVILSLDFIKFKFIIFFFWLVLNFIRCVKWNLLWLFFFILVIEVCILLVVFVLKILCFLLLNSVLGILLKENILL